MNVMRNIPYTIPADDVRILDVYLPEKGNGTLFFYVHGGGMEAGDKNDADAFAPYLTERGVAVVSINYRMYPAACFPDFIRDAALALAYVKENKAAFGAEKSMWAAAPPAGSSACCCALISGICRKWA